MRLIFILSFFFRKDSHKFSAGLAGLLFFIMGCQQQPNFDSQASRSNASHTRRAYCPDVDMSDFKECVEDNFYSIADRYAGKDKLSSSEKARLLEELLVGQTYQTCADETELWEQLKELNTSGQGQCRYSDIMQSFLRFSDQLILRVAGRVVRKIR